MDKLKLSGCILADIYQVHPFLFFPCSLSNCLQQPLAKECAETVLDVEFPRHTILKKIGLGQCQRHRAVHQIPPREACPVSRPVAWLHGPELLNPNSAFWVYDDNYVG